MIVKEWTGKVTTDKKLKAGQEAEKQMAFYLKREFGKDKNIFVFNNLRIIHEDEVVQIDHLILHAYGFILVESKSVTGTVRINKYDEWSYIYNQGSTKEISKGMPSPINQLERQRKILKEILCHNTEMLGKLLGIQKGFGAREYDYFVAFSDQAIIHREKETQNIFKADAITDIVRERINKLKSLSSSAAWFNKKELENITNFLLDNDRPKDKLPKQSKKTKATLTNEVKEPLKKYETKSTVKKKKAKPSPNKPPFMCDKCNESFEIRFGHSFYLYCPSCHRRPLALHPLCPKCGYEVNLERQSGTRIVEYKCSKDKTHFGIYHKNRDIYLKDKR